VPQQVEALEAKLWELADLQAAEPATERQAQHWEGIQRVFRLYAIGLKRICPHSGSARPRRPCAEALGPVARAVQAIGVLAAAPPVLDRRLTTTHPNLNI
jgi:hypothetical protein